MRARLAVAVAAAGALVSVAAAQASAEQGGQHISDLRAATAKYASLSVAEGEGFGVVPDAAGVTCIHDPAKGGMGTHFGPGSRIGDGEISLLEPEILLYDLTSTPDRFLGVEYTVFVADWEANHGSQPPKLFGKKFTLVPAGNRYGIPAFYEQHVWLGESNVVGLLKDYNPGVSC
ncbi:hypothetical protein [Nocardioides sp. B-3]|uniref:hypothetical protein n=1 Tax=Nocardioides sp. B-3 TaxID=2895565 RepID=UPI0021530F6D|nr:hypothetical protein [Nocardioides sp. B-3]UUZ58892.1 hypothetical protein LP418_22975 [Nocardioides sp. B-3]